MKLRSLLPALLVLLLSFLYLASSVTPARADSQFNVNSTADIPDVLPGDGVCGTGNGGCTLRAAIQEANALPGHDTILLPGGTYSLILPGSGEDASATGDLDITDDLTLGGAAAYSTTVVGVGLADRVFHIVTSTVRVHLSNLTIRGGSPPIEGEEAFGGGIYNAGLMAVDATIIRDNVMREGGGIYNAGVMTLTNSTLTQNWARGTEVYPDGGGGGLYNTGTISVTNTTISDNSASGGEEGSGHGGGIANRASMWLINTTVYRNGVGGYWASGHGGGLNNSGSLVMKHTLLAGNTTSYRQGEFMDDCYSWPPILSQGYNFIQGGHSGPCFFTDETPTHIEGLPASLGELADNGGPTPTHAPWPGSFALDAGDPTGCTDATGAPLDVDQRGLPRPADGDGDGEVRCDIGAVEVQGYVPPPPGPPSLVYENVEPVGDIGGQTYAVAVQGRYAYSGMGWRMVVVDVLDPANPTIVGTSDFFPRGVQGIAVAGDYAYVAAGGLYIVDVSDPTNPTTVGSLAVPGRAMDVALDGQYAYVAAGDGGGLQIIDVSDPAAPVKVGHYHTATIAQNVTVSGTHAYVADEEVGLYILDVSDPSAPSRVALLTDYEGPVRDVLVAGGYAYVTEGTHWEFASHLDEGGGLHILDVSDPAMPEEVAFYDTKTSGGGEGGAHALAMAGSNVYVADWANGIYVIDVSDPTAPAQIGSVQDLAAANELVIAGDYAYVAGEAYLSIVDISSPSAATNLGRIHMPRLGLGSIAANGDYLYVVGGDVTVVDVTNPSLPVQLGVYEIPGAVNRIVASGDYIYVLENPEGSPEGGLHIVDVRDAMSPTLAGFYDTPGTALDLAVVGNRAYVADGDAGLHILDISNPAAPALLGTYPGQARKVAVAGNYAYVVQRGTWSGEQWVGGGLRILDVSDPTTPQEVGFFANAHPPMESVTVAGNYAYVTELGSTSAEPEAGGGLRILDVSDPTAPRQVAFYEALKRAREVVVRENFAYVVDEEQGLCMLDVSNPSIPFELGFIQTSDTTRGVAVDENYIYTTHSALGLVVQRYNPSVPTALRMDSFGAPPSSPSYLGLAALLLAPIVGLILVRRRQQQS